MLKKIIFFNALPVLVLVSACSGKLNTDYQQAHNGKLLTLPSKLNEQVISHQYVLENAKKPITIDYKPPI